MLPFQVLMRRPLTLYRGRSGRPHLYPLGPKCRSEPGKYFRQKNYTLKQVTNRLLHECLFSLNITLVLKLQTNQKPNKFFSWVDAGVPGLPSAVNKLTHLQPHHHFGFYFVFCISALTMALVLLLMLRLVSHIPGMEKFATPVT